MNEHKHKKRWLILAPVGLILVGMGLSLTIDAAIFRYDGAETTEWLAYGTFGLVVFNSGLSIFGHSIIERVRSERKEP